MPDVVASKTRPAVINTVEVDASVSGLNWPFDYLDS